MALFKNRSLFKVSTVFRYSNRKRWATFHNVADKNIIISRSIVKKDSPRYATALHMIGQRDVIRPYVKLPLSETQNSAEHRSAVNAYSHVQIHLRTPRWFITQVVTIGGVNSGLVQYSPACCGSHPWWPLSCEDPFRRNSERGQDEPPAILTRNSNNRLIVWYGDSGFPGKFH